MTFWFEGQRASYLKQDEKFPHAIQNMPLSSTTPKNKSLSSQIYRNLLLLNTKYVVKPNLSRSFSHLRNKHFLNAKFYFFKQNICRVLGVIFHVF